MTILPNHLTLSRLFLALGYAICLSYPSTVTLGLAVFLTVASLVSDALDGYLARSQNIISKFGICFDPVADKIFNLCAFAMLVTFDRLALPAFAFVLIIIREVGISGVRVVLLSSEQTLIPAERFGKLKSALQFALVFILTLGLWLESWLGMGSSATFWMDSSWPVYFFWGTALYTFASSWVHLWRHRKALLAAWRHD